MSPPAQTALAQDQPLCHDNTCSIQVLIVRSATSRAIRQFDVNDDIVSTLHVSISLFDVFLRHVGKHRKTAASLLKKSCFFQATWSSRIWINMRINPFASNFFHSCVNGIFQNLEATGAWRLMTTAFSKIRPLWWPVNQGPWLWHDKPTYFG